MSKNWIYSWRWCFSKKHPQFFRWGSSAKIIGIPTTGPVVKNHILPKMAKINCNIANYGPFVVPRLSTSSSTSSSPATPTSSSKDTVISTGGVAGKPSRGSAETESTKKNEDDEVLRGELLQDVLEWLHVDKNVQPHQYSPSSSHELPVEPRAKVVPGPGRQGISTNFPKDRNCDICLRTKITRASCRKRTGTVVPRAEHFGDLITADHNVLSEGCEWTSKQSSIRSSGTRLSYPCKTKTSQQTKKSLQKFLVPTRKPRVIYTDNYFGIWQSLWRINLESLYVITAQIRNKWDCWESSA